MNFNSDGFNERSNYIHNANDRNRLNNMDPNNYDSSLARMRIDENRPDVKTVNTDKTIMVETTRGTKENFVIRNHNMMNANAKTNSNNPVSNAINRNMFKKF